MRKNYAKWYEDDHSLCHYLGSYVKPVLKNSMGGGVFIQPFLSGRKCNTVRYTKGNVKNEDRGWVS